MKKVTFTFTRQTAETPWYWQIAPSNTLDAVQDFVEVNNSGVETHAYVIENDCIVTFTFNNEQLIEEFLTVIDDEIKTDYLQYCEDNNITFTVVTEDI